MNTLLDNFKAKLKKGEIVIGPFMKTGDAAFVEAAGYAGFDFTVLDLEHGPLSVESMQNNIRAANVANIIPIIRVQDNNEVNISKALDIGALGVQVPQVQDAEQAEGIVRAARFFPLGERGVCRFVRAARYSSMERKEYFKAANESILILQLEGVESIRNIDSILNVSGIDIIFIGPYDLSQSLGIPGEINHPEVINKMKFIVNKARNRNIVVGTFVDQIENISRWKNAGVQYLCYSVDVGIFLDACKDIVITANKQKPSDNAIAQIT